MNPPPAHTRHIAITATIACLSVAAAWWSTRSSLGELGTSREFRPCPAIAPPPPSCHPSWHVQVTTLVTLAVVAVFVGALLAIRRRGRANLATLTVVVIAGFLAWVVAAYPSRFLPIW